MKNLTLLINYFKYCSFLLILILCKTTLAQEELKFDKIPELKSASFESEGIKPEKKQKKMDKFFYHWRDRLTERGTPGKLTKAFPPKSKVVMKGAKNIPLCQSDHAN